MKTVTAVTVTPATASIAVGTMQQFKANATFSDGTMMDVTSTATWSSSSMATATVSSSGQATAVAKGSATITATYMSKSGTAALTVTAATLKSIAVTPTNPSIVAGLTQQFTATGSFSDGSVQDLTMTATWSSSSTATATINATGLAKGVAAGTSTISAVTMGVTGKTTLTVTKANLLSIQILPNPGNTTVAGATVPFKATGNYSDGTTPDITAMVTWASSQTTIATISNTAPNQGVATPAASGSGGTTNITATLGSVSGTAVLVVSNAKITSLTIAPLNDTIAAGTTVQFTATAGYQDGSSANVTSQATWSSGTTSTATISATGLATGVAMGSTMINASFGGLMASTNLTVSSAMITGLTVSPMAGSTYLGGANVQFTATATFTSGPAQNVTTSATWSSSSMAIATISNTAPNQGLASPGTTAGTATITATFMGQTATATLVVSGAQITALNVTPAMASIAAGSNQQFTATATYSAGPSQDVTSSATWQSSSLANATINASGLAHGVAATSGTPVTITATFGGIQATAQLTVTAATLTGITISSNPTAPATIPAGQTITFTAQGQYSDGSTQVITNQVTWTQNPNSGYLSFAGNVATGAAVGTTTITATLSGVTSNGLVVNVSSAVLTGVQVNPPNPYTQPTFVGGQVQFSCQGTYSDGSTSDLTATAAWVSSNNAAATIQSTGAANPGLATAVASGSTNITCASGGFTSSKVALQVSNATLVTIAVTPASATLHVGQTQQFKATGTYTGGGTQDITNTVTWTSAKPAFYTVSAAGLATGVASSTPCTPSGCTAYGLTASQGAIQGVAQVTVQSNTVTGVAVNCESQRFFQGLNLSCIPSGQGFQVACWSQATYSDGTTGDVTTTATWASTTPSVATAAATTSACPSGFGGSSGQCEDLTIIGPASGQATTTATAGVPGTCSGGTCTGTSGAIQGTSGETIVSMSGCTPNSALFMFDNANGFLSSCTNTVNLGVKDQVFARAGYTGSCTAGTIFFDVSQQASWTSSNPGAATVSSTAGSKGEVTTVAAGGTTISASWLNYAGAFNLTVNNACLQALSISQAGSTYPLDVDVPLTVNGFYSNAPNTAVPLSPSTTTVSWTGATVGTSPGGASPTEWVLDTSQWTGGSGTLSETLAASATGCNGATVTSPNAKINIDTGALPTSLSLSPSSSTITIGGSEDMTATATYSTYGSFVVSQECTTSPCWSTSPSSGGTVTFNPDTSNTSLAELAQSAANSAAGNYTVSFTYRNQTANAQLSVSGRTVTGIAFSPTPTVGSAPGSALTAGNFPNGVPVGLPIAFPVLISYSDGGSGTSLSGVTFSATGNALGAFNGDGTTTAQAGATVVTASIAGTGAGCPMGTCSATFNVTVGTQTLSNISSPNGTIGENQTESLTVTGLYNDGTTANISSLVSSSSSNGSIVAVSTTAGGTTIQSFGTTGTANLTFALGSVTGNPTTAIQVQASGVCVTGLTVTPANVNPLPQGAQQQFTATATFSSGPNQNATAALITGTMGSGWTSSNANVASIVLGSGLATGGSTAGTATITATAIGSITIGANSYNVCNGGNVGGTTVTGTAQVTSSSATVASISLSTAQGGLLGIPLGEAEQLVVTGTLTNSNTINIPASQITFSSNSVNSPVNAQGVVTGAGATMSPATLTATYNPNNTLSSSITLSVANCGAPAVADCEQVSSTSCINPGNDLPVGNTAQFTATATFNGCSFSGPAPSFIESTATWSTSNGNASVNSSGAATGSTAGSVNVCATYDTVKGCDNINVVTLSSLSVTPSPVDVGVGGVQALTVTATDNLNNTIPTPSVSWFVANPAMATINASNVLQAGSTQGSTTFYAQSGSVQSNSVTVNVGAACISSISLGTTTGSNTMPTGVPFGVTVQCTDSNGNSATCPTPNFAATGLSGACFGAIPPAGEFCVGLAATETVGVSVTGCNGNAVSNTLTITPTSVTATGITLSTPTGSVGVNTAARFITQANYSSGPSFDVSALATLSSQNLSVAVPNTPNPTDDVNVFSTVESQSTTGTAGIVSTWGGLTSNTATLTVDTTQTLVGILVESDASAFKVSGNSFCATAASPCTQTSAQYPGGGFNLQLHAYAIYNNTPMGSNGGEITSQVTWSLTDAAMTGSTVANGAQAGRFTTGSAAGGAVTVKASSGSVNQTFTLTVDSVAISAASIVSSTGGAPTTSVPQGTATYEAQVTTSAGNIYWVTSNYSWSSSNLAVGTIVQNPPSTGATYTAVVSSGNTNVSATRGTSTAGPLAVTDSMATPSYVVCSPASVTISAPGDTAQLTATVFFSDGNSLDETATASFQDQGGHVGVTGTPGVIQGQSATGGTPDTIKVSYTANGVTATTSSPMGQACSVTVQ